MKAFSVAEPGGQAAQLERDIPDPGPGEVRVKVTAASVNGFDLAVAAGYMAEFFEHRYPLVLGREFTGTVDSLGAEIDAFEIGDRVFGVVSNAHLAEGAFAEYTTVDATTIIRTPDALSDAEAASLGHTGSTALAAIAALGDVDGKTVLIVGATGGVGTLLTQLAAAAGAEVIATARTDEGRSMLSALGAAHVVDYADLAASVREVAPHGVDAAVHLAGDANDMAGIVIDGGVFASAILYAPEMFPEAERISPAPIAGYPSPDTLRVLAGAADEGRLRVIIDHEHPFDEVGAAFAAFGHGSIGNIVVQIG